MRATPSYSDASKATTDTFFAVDGGAIEGYTVLSKDEWKYLIDNSIAKKEVSINGKSCTVLKPDGFSGTVNNSYTAEQWATAEASGLVALPFAGYYTGHSIVDAGSIGNYWSSTPNEDNADNAWNANFSSDLASPSGNNRNNGYSVRLVQVQNSLTISFKMSYSLTYEQLRADLYDAFLLEKKHKSTRLCVREYEKNLS